MPHGKVTKIQLASPKRAKRWPQVTTRQQWTDTKAWETQDTKNTNGLQKMCSEMDQDTLMFGLHERPLAYQCIISKNI